MTAVLANDTLEGLSNLGSETGEFLGNLAPGLGKFLLIVGIFGGIVGLITAIIFLIRKKIKV